MTCAMHAPAWEAPTTSAGSPTICLSVAALGGLGSDITELPEFHNLNDPPYKVVSAPGHPQGLHAVTQVQLVIFIMPTFDDETTANEVAEVLHDQIINKTSTRLLPFPQIHH